MRLCGPSPPFGNRGYGPGHKCRYELCRIHDVFIDIFPGLFGDDVGFLGYRSRVAEVYGRLVSSAPEIKQLLNHIFHNEVHHIDRERRRKVDRSDRMQNRLCDEMNIRMRTRVSYPVNELTFPLMPAAVALLSRSAALIPASWIWRTFPFTLSSFRNGKLL